MKEGYLPLYRKYRPQKLEDIVGQPHIKTALANAINLNKISHAYLFTGPRGTGKTSTARILAKSLNCINGPTVTPCGVCESCKAITGTIPIDVIEIDAASNRSVEDAHNILEKVQYAPVGGKYKIYIIDEVHMLTPQAFNALLKTLEEPPKNVIFILATTEAHKVLDTIKSRCQRFDFKRITTNDIIEHLKQISQKEGINITDGAISAIAKSSAGGMRDSLALLDQVGPIGISKEITEDDIDNLLGRLSFDILNTLANHIANSNPAEAIKVLEKIYNDGNEPVQILTNLLMYFKNLLIFKTCDLKTSIELTGLTDSQLKSLEKLKNSLETHQILFLINKSAEYIKEMKSASNQQMWLEVSLIDLSNLAVNTKLVELQDRLTNLETGNYSMQKPAVCINSAAADSIKIPAKAVHIDTSDKLGGISKSDLPSAADERKISTAETSNIKTLWVRILHNIKSQSDQALFALASPVKISEEEIVLTIKNASFVKKANTSERKQCIIAAAAAVMGKQNIPVKIREPLPDDIKIEKINTAVIKKQVSADRRTLVKDEPQITESELETAEAAKNNISSEPDKNNDLSHSDQSSMIKDLFDGKFLD